MYCTRFLAKALAPCSGGIAGFEKMGVDQISSAVLERDPE
jgi:hypothetical protein